MNIEGIFSLFSFIAKSIIIFSLIAFSVNFGSSSISSFGIPVISSELFNLKEEYSCIKPFLEHLKSPCPYIFFTRIESIY